MLHPDELIVDSFAGGGGASIALTRALGREPDIAINHDPEAVAMHKANHPGTLHYCQNIWKADPRAVANGRPIGVAWFSPDCTHHSKAKGGKPLGTVVAGGIKHALVSAFLAQHNSGMVGHHAEEPVSTIVQKGCTQALVAAHMINLKGSDRRDRAADEPANTICSGGMHIAEVRSFLVKYHRDGGQLQDPRDPLHTIPTHDSFGLVKVQGVIWQIADIGMRMLAAPELFLAQGFPRSYKINVIGPKGTPLSKTSQIHQCGNSVSPPPAEALIAANMAQQPRVRRLLEPTPLERVAA